MRTAAKITKEKLKEKIDIIIPNEYDFNFTDRIYRDLDKVMFDMENVTATDPFGKLPCGYKTLRNGMEVLFVNAGGDWEDPVAFILYWDGKRIRAYIPKEGNTWDIKYKTAHGSQMEREEWPKGEDVPEINLRVANFTDMENDIINRIKYK